MAYGHGVFLKHRTEIDRTKDDAGERQTSERVDRRLRLHPRRSDVLKWARRSSPLRQICPLNKAHTRVDDRRSLHIFCIHTVELIAIPWYLFAARFVDRPVTGLLLQYLISLASIWLVCALLQLRRDLMIKFFPARRKSPRTRYAARH